MPTRLLLALALSFPAAALAEGLRDYKQLKHRELKKEASGKTVQKPCTEAYVETCEASCADPACRAKCQADAGPYCQARAEQEAKAGSGLLLKALLLALGPLVTFLDGPPYVAYQPQDEDPFKPVWNAPSFHLDVGGGYFKGNTWALATAGSVRFGYLGLLWNGTYFTQGADNLAEVDAGPAFFLGSQHIIAGMAPVVMGSFGNGVLPVYGFGVRTSTTIYLDRFYLVFSPMLGRINDLWNFSLRAGLGYRFNEMLAMHLAYEHRGVVDLATLAVREGTLNGAILYFSLRVN